MTDRKKDYFMALYEVARVVNASLKPSKVLEEIVSRVSGVMAVKGCTLRLLDSRKKRLLMGVNHMDYLPEKHHIEQNQRGRCGHIRRKRHFGCIPGAEVAVLRQR